MQYTKLFLKDNQGLLRVLENIEEFLDEDVVDPLDNLFETVSTNSNPKHATLVFIAASTLFNSSSYSRKNNQDSVISEDQEIYIPDKYKSTYNLAA